MRRRRTGDPRTKFESTAYLENLLRLSKDEAESAICGKPRGAYGASASGNRASHGRVAGREGRGRRQAEDTEILVITH